MAKPTDLYPWATDVGATVDPGPAREATGFRTGKKPPAKWFNFLFNGAYQWFQYLNNLHGETQFLNKIYHWTGIHTYSNAATFNGGATFNDDVVAGLIEADSYAYETPPTRTIMVPLGAGTPEGDPAMNWQRDTVDGQTWISAAPTAKIYFDLNQVLRTGMTLTRVRVAIDQNAGGVATEMSMSVYRKTVSKAATPLPPSMFSPGSDLGSNIAAAEILSTAVMSEVIDLSVQEWQLLVISSSEPINDRIMWVEVQVIDPGPRNH